MICHTCPFSYVRESIYTSGALWVSVSKLTCIVSLLAIGLAITTGTSSYCVSAYVGHVVTY